MIPMQKHNWQRGMLLVGWVLVMMLLPRLVPAATTPERIIIQGLSSVTIDGGFVRLGDIATVQGPDGQAVKRLRKIEIAKAPLPGKSRGIDADYVRLRLRQYGVDLNRLDLRFKTKVLVTRRHMVVSKRQVAERVTEFIYRNSPWPREKMTIKKVHISSPVVLPPGEFSHQVLLNSQEDLAGRVHLPVVFQSRSGLQKKVWATLEIEVLKPVVVTRRAVGRSTVITADDVIQVERDAAEVPNDALTRLEDVIGKRAKRFLQAQSVISARQVTRPTLIKRGDVVRIIARTEGLQITTLGEARRKGGRGDRIQVMNLDSKKVLHARIIDARTVQVDF